MGICPPPGLVACAGHTSCHHSISSSPAWRADRRCAGCEAGAGHPPGGCCPLTMLRLDAAVHRGIRHLSVGFCLCGSVCGVLCVQGSRRVLSAAERWGTRRGRSSLPRPGSCMRFCSLGAQTRCDRVECASVCLRGAAGWLCAALHCLASQPLDQGVETIGLMRCAAPLWAGPRIEQREATTPSTCTPCCS